MIAVIDDHRGLYGVEPIWKVLPIAPSTYDAHVTKRADPERLSARVRRDVALKPEISRVFKANFEVYGIENLASDGARTLRYRPLHRGEVDARLGPSGCHSR